jgi:hypothetical protein
VSIPNTTATPQFLEEQPDWSKPVSLEIAWKTDVQTARDGSEQRAGRRGQPRYRFGYVISALNIAQFALRRAKGILEQGAALCVPVWTDPHTLANTITTAGGQAATLGAGMDGQKFKVGSYAYIVQTGKPTVFRQITAVGSTTVTLAAGGTVSYTAGAEVYPCIVGLTTDGLSFAAGKLDDTDETVLVEEL